LIEYIARRLVLGIFTVWAISVLAFIVIQLPEGDSVDLTLTRLSDTSDEFHNPELANELRKYFGLDAPLHVRYSRWAWNLLQGDLGLSIPAYRGWRIQVPVKKVIGDRLWLTVALTGFTMIVTWTLAIPIGIYSATRHHSIGDYAFTFVGFAGLAVPDFLLGLVLMYVAFAYFDQSVGGLFSADYADAHWGWPKIYDLIKHLWVPAIVLGTSGTASLIRIMRNNLLDELGKPYVISAQARGCHPLKVVFKYPVRIAINPLVSTIGYLLPSLVSGSVIVSVVLSLPTLGPILLDGILSQDSHLTGFIILMLGVLTVTGTLISDILLAVVDPRIKLSEK
jgi:peptide/nickel transport system permease protein